LVYTRVYPDVVVELVVDFARDGPRRRHPVRFLRIGPDLQPSDLVSEWSDARAACG
jgi:hypothetical protein